MAEMDVDPIPVPAEVAGLVAAIKSRMRPAAIWLFGSRARGDQRVDSDWDLLVSLPDTTPPEFLDPLMGWRIQREVGVRATILITHSSDLAEIWGVPNTLGFELSQNGKRLDV